MRIKSYFSGTVEAAMDLARRELGEEAVILNSRAAPPEARHLGAYEVVFGVDDAPAPAPCLEPVPKRGPESGPERGHRFEMLEGEVVTLRHELRKLSRGLVAPESAWKSPASPAGQSPESRRQARELTAFLVRRELPELPAVELVRRAGERLRRPTGVGNAWQRPAPSAPAPLAGLFVPSGVFSGHAGLLAGLFADESPLASAMLEELSAVLRVAATLGRQAATPEPKPGPRVVALVGAPGAGKTTTLVKLAAQYGLRGRRPAHIISTDNLRVGAAEQLRSYAAILGLGFDLAETTVALGQLLNEHAGKELILIDTPGLSASQMPDGAHLARFLSTDPRVDCHLVVPAYQKGPDVARLLDRFHPYGVAKVILTRLDETSAVGGLLLALDENEAPVSFLSMGQTIPEDLEPASIARLLDLFVGDPPMGVFLPAGEPPPWFDESERVPMASLRA